MKQISFFIFAALIPASALLAEVETVWVKGVSEDSGWYDVDKYLKYDEYADTFYSSKNAENTVSSFCWGATAANMLQWYQSAYSGKLPAAAITSTAPNKAYTSKDILDNFVNNWSNKGGRISEGLKWYLSGYDVISAEKNIQYSNGASFPFEVLKDAGLTDYEHTKKGSFDTTVNYSDGGYLGLSSTEALAAVHHINFSSKGLEAGTESKDTILKTIKDGLAHGVVGIEMSGHAVSCWGMSYDETDPGATKLFLTDSDDNVTRIMECGVNIVMTQDAMGNNYVSDVQLTDYGAFGINEDGTATTVWTEVTGTSTGIKTLSLLYAPIPEPSMFGLIAGTRRKRK